jgi:WD40 repeat protein
VSPSSSSPALLLATSAEGGDKQLLARFDLNAQQVDRDFTMQFNAPRSANQNEGLNALEWDAAQRRMLVASSGRVISLYDCAASPSAPPTLLHRLLNGHEAAVQALALDTSPLLANGGGGAAAGMLASGGADGSVLLWNLGLKGAERTTTIWARLRAHVAPVTALAWSAPVGSGSIGPAGAAGAASAASANVALGRYLVSGDELGYVCVWDARRRGCIMAFRAHAASVRSLQISRTMEVLSASTDKSTKLWQLV